MALFRDVVRSLRLAVLALLLALPACAKEPPRPLLWQACDADNCIYLLGSFHLLTADDYPLAPVVEQAFGQAARLVFEVAPEALADPSLAAEMQRLARRDDGSRLQDSLPPELWARLADYAAKHGLPLEALQGQQAWAVSMSISLMEMQRYGLQANFGLDRHFMQRAAAAGKPTAGLETVREQLQVFAAMSAEEQQQALQEMLDKLEDFEADVRELHRLWRSGDAEGLSARMLGELAEKYPALYARVQTDRNRAWMPALQRLLDDEQVAQALVIVGSMHLLGEEGLLAMLRQAGYRVERLH